MRRLYSCARSRPILCAVALLAAVLMQAPPARAAAQLENFQLPKQIRIAGQYDVVFKTAGALTALQSLTPAARASQLKGDVLPDRLPISDADIRALANAIAAKVGGHSLIIFPASNGLAAYFTLSGVTEASMRALAADPRIDVIRADSSEFQDTCEDARSYQ